ncbi:FG-GAP-like repeat-containing protein, partial [uncultured Nitrosomonas sp.]|uniref:beta strand repeat-containing protein n=1 Tax=uncultured Nitrosomonas sp. TaxID=156424 RepID=UPI0025F0DF4F
MTTTTSINLSSLDGSNGFRIDGLSYYLSGFWLSSAGDMNGDGFDDVAISTTYFREYSGNSYIVFGMESGFSASSNLGGFRAGSNGWSKNTVDGVGDVNGDGFDDVIVVTETDNFYGDTVVNDTYVIFGKASDLDRSNGFSLEAGLDVQASGAGDVNGDGLGDLIIGAPLNDSYSGSSYVVFGNSSGFDATMDISGLDGTNGFRLDGIAELNLSGYSVDGAGDVNGDGFDDVIIGASSVDSNGFHIGSGYVVFGKASGFSAAMSLSALDGSNGFRLDGAVMDRSVVRAAGDINGDGYSDVLVSGRSSGSYVVFGKAAGFDATMDLSDLDGSNGFHLDGAGQVISANSAGDVNGDGFDDVIIGNSRGDSNGEDSGSSYVMFGKTSGFDAEIKLSDLDSTNSIRLNGVAAGDRSGHSVSSAGDVNGDGFDDLMLAATGTDWNTHNSGSVYVIFGASQFNGVVTYVGLPADDVFTGTAAAEHFDPSDGNDLLIGGGGADVMYGGNDDDTIRVSDLDFQLVDGGSGNDTLGLDGGGMNLDLANTQGKISGIETIDLNGSGNNILTLTSESVVNLSDTTNILIVKGNDGDHVAGLSDWVDNGIQGGFHVFTHDRAVLNIANIVTTDFIANGNIDLSLLNGMNGFRLDGVKGDDYSGYSVSSAGDVNGDGFDDVIIGAPRADPNGQNSGSSYVVFGKASEFDATMNLSDINGSNGFRLDGVASYDYSGKLVSTAGDVNGDGFDDLLIDVPGDDSNGQNSGSSYVVFGKASGFDATMGLSDLDGDNGFRLDGMASFDLLGKSVSTAGDVNGDGFDDLLIGDPNADPNGRFSSGSSYVVFGKASGFDATINLSDLDGSNGFRLDGDKAGESLGLSVSGAGDVNGDGFGDVIIGGNSENYVFFGKASGFDATMDLSDLDGINGFRLDGMASFDLLGKSVSTAGDVNGDGFDDLLIGDPNADPNGRFSSGSSYVVFGKASGFDATINLSDLDGSNGFRLDGDKAGESLGLSVSGAGDVNGDGFGDVIIGGNSENYVFFGKASGFDATMNLADLNSSSGFYLEGMPIRDRSASVSDAGDVNGDGLADLIVGAYGADPNGNDSGSSYIIFGRSDFTDGDEVDFPGTSGDDIFTGTKAAESFEGGEGNDRMIGRGGADSFDGGTGNDYIRILGDDFLLVD